jgi:hypothetical protein
MKQILLSFLGTIIASTSVLSQTVDFGGPISWKREVSDPKQIPLEIMSGFDLSAIQAEDQINDQQKDIPWRFGYKYTTSISLANSGKWDELPNGSRLWRTRIKCEGAMTINLLLEDVYFPEGSRFYLFDRNNTNRVGAYTSINNREDGLLGTELVHGEEIVVEYYEPAEVRGLGHFTISNVIHGYRSLNAVQNNLIKGLNDSGDCNIDVHCPLGAGWEDQIRSVAMIVAGGNGICTGALINNTCNDGTPYFLTAEHCLGGSTGNWAFRFNWASPPGTEDCATTANSTDPGPPYDQTANGATVLVSGTQADHALLEIDNLTLVQAQDWNLFFAGWNNDDTESAVTEVTGIHHPSGDLMKICVADDAGNGIFHANNGGAATWEIDAWEEGVTEPGSSGSPLFDQNKRIIGQLYGGAAACSGTVNNGQYDYYGRLGVSWGLGIGDYLAPVSCGGSVPNTDGWDPNGPSDPDDASIQSVLSPIGLYCSDWVVPQVRLRNAGGNNLTSCVINYNIDGGANQTYNWSGNLAPNATEIVTLPGLSSGAGAHVLNAFTTNPNGTTDTDPANDASLSNYEIELGGYQTTLELLTDCYGQETYWELEDATSTVIAFGGNTSGIPPGGSQNAANGDPGAYPDNTLIEVTMCLNEGCYDFTIYDDWGDGLEGSASWGCNEDGSYEIVNSSGTILGEMQNVAFGNSETINFCVVNNAGLNSLKDGILNIYPNPNNGSFVVDMNAFGSGTKTIRIRDISGRLIEELISTHSIQEVSISEAQTGIYLIEVLSGQDVFTSRVLVKN